MTPREEKVMLRDIHKIAQALESIANWIGTPINLVIGETKETDEETRE